MFFNWIMGLAIVAAVIYPFSTSAPFSQKGATAIVDLVLGLAITSLLTAVTARSVRRVQSTRVDRRGAGRRGADHGGYASQGQYGDQGYAPRPGYPGQVEDDYPTQVEQGYVPGQRAIPAEPTQPLNPSRYRRRR